MLYEIFNWFYNFFKHLVANGASYVGSLFYFLFVGLIRKFIYSISRVFSKQFSLSSVLELLFWTKRLAIFVLFLFFLFLYVRAVFKLTHFFIVLFNDITHPISTIMSYIFNDSEPTSQVSMSFSFALRLIMSTGIIQAFIDSFFDFLSIFILIFYTRAVYHGLKMGLFVFKFFDNIIQDERRRPKFTPVKPTKPGFITKNDTPLLEHKTDL